MLRDVTSARSLSSERLNQCKEAELQPPTRLQFQQELQTVHFFFLYIYSGDEFVLQKKRMFSQKREKKNAHLVHKGLRQGRCNTREKRSVGIMIIKDRQFLHKRASNRP